MAVSTIITDLTLLTQKLDEIRVELENKPFTDPDFPRQVSSIYVAQDKLTEKKKKDISKLKWMRPREICLKNDLIGFYEISREKASPEEIQDLSGKEKADGSRIT